ncbi:MAG: NEW3 domain-containing protein [Gemmataceae bacterium]
MKRMLLTGALLVVAGLMGCNQSDRGGNNSDRTPSSATFRVSAPTLATTIKQGDKQTVKLSLDRGSNFKETVALKADAPSGITVDLEPRNVKASDSADATASVSVAKDAAVGEHKVKVTATPETGNATDVTFSVKVEKKSD